MSSSTGPLLDSSNALNAQVSGLTPSHCFCSRWIVAQQKVAPSAASGGEGSQELRPSYHDEAKGVFGCEHYQRNCKVKAACCGQLVTCRFCHDKDSDHTMDR
jgi:zinc finger-like protein